MNRFKDHDVVCLKAAIDGLPAGARGTVVDSYSQEYLVEFAHERDVYDSRLLQLHESQLDAWDPPSR